MKPYLLRLHRWGTLAFALPLLAVVISGTLLSVEPWLQRARPSQSFDQSAVLTALAMHDPDGKATGLTVRTFDQIMTISGVGPGRAVHVRLPSGEVVEQTALARWLGTARQLHEGLLLDLGWLVIASTIAMVFILALGALMGWPRLRNSLGGWHSTGAWVLLPLLSLSTLTGLAIAFGISFLPPQQGPRPERVPIRDAVAMIARDHDLADLTSLRTRGGRQLARIYVGDRLTNFIVTKSGLQATGMNWPRALHEGNWHARIGSIVNVAVSLTFLGLWGTGLTIWFKRRFRKRQRPARARARASAA
jgi:uncharacterized iron-regulated membrane protein